MRFWTLLLFSLNKVPPTSDSPCWERGREGTSGRQNLECESRGFLAGKIALRPWVGRGGSGERNINKDAFGKRDQGPQSPMTSPPHRNSRPRKWETSREAEKHMAPEPLEMVSTTAQIIDEEMRFGRGRDGLDITNWEFSELGVIVSSLWSSSAPDKLRKPQVQRERCFKAATWKQSSESREAEGKCNC